MQLTDIIILSGTIRLESGLHIGGGDNEMHIGGTDNPVIKHPITNEPYIPGSSLKGKMRSLLEWRAGTVGISDGKPVSFKHLDKMTPEQKQQTQAILKLFGVSGGDKANGEEEEAARKEIGPTRLSFWDCSLDKNWTDDVRAKNLLLTEVKMENSINRISGTAENPRNTERVPAGAEFGFKLTLKQLHGDGGDLLNTVLTGLKLLEMDSLGGSGSRGYGKIKFVGLAREDGQALPLDFGKLNPFEKAGQS